MVKAELSYNPYLHETEIKFNGQPPRINSLVEKYQNGILQDWIKEVPAIFHDEMNGYDFEMLFSGTVTDFNEVKKAFIQAGVSEKQVMLFHRSELEDREQKLRRLESILNWLENNPSRIFDNEKFRKDNEILFDGAYSFVSIQGEQNEQPAVDWVNAKIEVIKNVHELDNTDLVYTPIVVCIDQSMMSELPDVLRYLYKRQDVVIPQIFFIIDPALNEEIVYRTIKDLGIRNPHIIKSFDDDSLKRYFRIYPETDYIYSSIRMFEQKAEEVESALEAEKAQGVETHSEIGETIQMIEAEIQKIQGVKDTIQEKNNIDKPVAFTNADNRLNIRISAWRRKKTKSIEEEEAKQLAEELQTEVADYLKDFADSIEESVSECVESIKGRLSVVYAASGCDDQFNIDNVLINEPNEMNWQDVTEDLLELKVKERVMRNGIGIFAIGNKKPEEDYVVQTAYYMQPWREQIQSITKPLAEEYSQKRIDALTDYSDRAIEAYSNHLMQVINEKTKEQNELTKQLSSEEQYLQKDSRWLSEYRQKLKTIARG